MTKKISVKRLLLSFWLYCGMAFAQTNDTNFYYVIHSRTKSFTNATVANVTPASVTVFWDGGGAEVPLADLPAAMQRKYHYDPAAAQAFMVARAEKKAAARARRAGEMAALTLAMNSLSEPRMVVVSKVICDCEVEILDGTHKTNVYMQGLPQDVAAFVNDYNHTRDVVLLNQNYNTSETYHVSGGFHHAGELTDNAKFVIEARAHLLALQNVALEKISIIARESNLVRDGFHYWKFERMAPTSLATQQGLADSAIALRMGIPLDIYNQIATEAASEFPHDYQEQHYVITKQLQAYRVLHPN